MHPQEPAEVARNLRDILGRDHRRLEKLFGYLLEEFEAGDFDGMRKMWDRFETGLVAHLDAEEKYLLPVFAKANPEEAAALLAEHASFRRLLEELGVGVDLRLVKLEIAKALVASLEAHARREDDLMYRWAEREAGTAELEAIRSAVTN